MKVKRYVAATSREALSRVKQELGPDAVILSNRAVGGGVEILALAQDDVAGLVDQPAARPASFPVQPGYTARPGLDARAASKRATKSAPRVETARGHVGNHAGNRADNHASNQGSGHGGSHANGGAGGQSRSLMDYAVHITPPAAQQPTHSAAQQPAARSSSPFALPSFAAQRDANASPGQQAAASPRVPGHGPAGSSMAAPAQHHDNQHLLAEMKAMRGAVERQLAGLAWNEDARRRPLKAKFLRELVAAGFSAPLARKVSGGLPDDYSEPRARSWLKAVLAKNIRCDSDAESLVQRGGVYALVGPTGVGKTTTVAKLAARCVVRFGAQKLALVSTDSYRIGAQDQLRIYARILGVPVHVAQDASELDHTLRALGERHLVLIDTVGMGQRDTRLAEQLALLAGKQVQRVLLLNATAQLETLEDVIRVYKSSGEPSAPGSLAGAIITKLDEARCPGSALDATIRHKLKLAFVTDGQRVPEDIHSPVASDLVERALADAGQSPFELEDDEFTLLPAADALKAG